MEEKAAARERRGSGAGARSVTVALKPLVEHHAILAVRSILVAAPSEWLAIGLCSDSEVVFSQGSTHGSVEMTAAELHRVALGLIGSGTGCVRIRVAPASKDFEPESLEDPPTASVTRVLTQSQTTADSTRGQCSNRLGNP